jgi:hypothetical protein
MVLGAGALRPASRDSDQAEVALTDDAATSRQR